MREELENQKAQSEFEKAAERLGIRVIHAHSAPAKGRIERSFRTDQDRLVKELRLRNISTLEEANRFLEEYWKNHNQRFSVAAMEPEDFHRPLAAGTDLNAILSVRTEHPVRKDGTIVHRGQWYQLMGRRTGGKAEVQEQCNGKMRIVSGERIVPYKKLAKRLELTAVPLAQARPRLRQVKRPAADSHPWKEATYKLRIASGGKLALAG
ncbi:MAG: hypothetical protein AB1439_03400 [candidate division FCPU426 bacterium]